MLIHPLSNQLSVTAQIEAVDVATLAAKGFRSIINNRPDGESGDQPSSAILAAAAKKAGLDYRYIPVVSGQLQQAQVQAFESALSEMSAPVLAFCRTGTRSSTLWALQAAGTADAILASASAAGYDLSALRPHLGDAAHGH
ncbi:MAG: TIGR01244 family sulfur transferase [Rhodanobacter sp.]